MVKSMTGYGRAEDTLGGCTITVELRSVNNRYLDCNIRIPRLYLFAEDAIKARVQKVISRGKVDVFVTLDNAGGEAVKVSVNRGVADGYYAALQELSQTYGLSGDISVSLLSRFPDVLLAEKAQEDVEQRAKDICSVLDRALADFDQMRAREGERLKEDVLSRAVRLRSHLSQLDHMLAQEGPVGRKLDFLIQEFNREANTIGSKCSDIEIARHVVDIKAEIEKIREQVQNIE